MFALWLLPAAQGQGTTGRLEGVVRSRDGRPVAGAVVVLSGGAGLQVSTHADAEGRFAVTVPYGRYLLVAGGSATFVFAAPLEAAGTWTDTSRGPVFPEGFTVQSALLDREPSTVSEPLNFSGLADNRLARVSQRAFSWTDTQYKLQGLDVTDSYQPGLPVVMPDVEALDVISSSSGTEIGMFAFEPEASWNGRLETANTGGALAWANLPADRGAVRQNDRFHWFTRDRVEVGGPVTRWADVTAAVAGEWSSQTVPLDAAPASQGSRELFGTARGRMRLSDHDRVDVLYSGTKVDLSTGGIPSGLEAWMGNRLMPSFVLPGGFPGEPEHDRFDFVQAGWTHVFAEPSRLGVMEVRYGISRAHLDTRTAATGESRVELLGGAISGAPPLANRALRTRQEAEAVWHPGQIVVAAGWKTSLARNRWTAPSNANVITVNGVPQSIVEFNAPADSAARVRSFSVEASDHIALGRALSFDVGARLDVSRGAGIAWNSISPRAGLAWRPPVLGRLILRGTYWRAYEPLAGRYLDFGNPNSLGGRIFNPAGTLLARFGGLYSSIAPSLKRPYADEFDASAEYPLNSRTTGRIRLFRRDEKNRLAAVDTGVPASAFTPVSILDPGPDGIPGTFDDQRLTVYAQNAVTLGQDRYELTNPGGLRMLHAGFVAEAGTRVRGLMLNAAFVTEKSYGPTNPGDSIEENDPGVIGALFLDPNTEIHAAGRSFLDRAYVGKIRATYRLRGGIEVASVADYMDGLVFARQLSITGLPQGPFLVASTVRGSPEGGNRAQYVLNWNLRIGRRFVLPVGTFRAMADVLNVLNGGRSIQQSDLSGPAFNQRLPVAIQPVRFVRIGLEYSF